MTPLKDETHRPALLAGQKLGHFEVLSLLGKGGMGEVYRARDLRLHRDVAIKTLPESLAGDYDRLARLEREAQVASSLNHPNIVSVYDIGQQDGLAWIVSELVEGSSLRQSLGRGAFPLRRALEIAIQIADGLAGAHAAGLVHRDLKPENIMLARDGRVKILDFGLAKNRLATSSGILGSGNSITDTLIISGTPAYMAPEQILGRTCDQRSDIFSLGVVVSEMLSGKRPFSGDTVISSMNSVLSEEPAELPETVPAPLRRLIRHCLEKEPNRRLQSAADFSFEVRLHLEDPSESGGRASKQGRRAAWLVFAGGLLCVSLGAFWAGRQNAVTNPYADGTLRRLTWDSGLTTDGTISSDGKFVAYASDRGNENHLNLYVQQIDSDGIVKLSTDGADNYHPVFSPDGSQIVFRSERGEGALYQVAALGGQPPRLIVPRGEWPRFSPDGHYLLYALGVKGSPFSLFVQPVAGGTPIEITSGCSNLNRAAVWAPDSAHVLFEGNCQNHDSVWLASVDGRPPVDKKASWDFWHSHKLESEGMPITLDEWLPRSSELLVPLVDHDASFEAAIGVKADGRMVGPVRRVSFGPVRIFRASASESGRLVLSTFLQSSNILKLKVDSHGKAVGPAQAISSGPAETIVPALSRDGKLLAYATRTSDRWVLQVKNLETGVQRNVAWESDSLRYPIFGPDSESLIYSNASQSKRISLKGGMPETLPFNNAMDWASNGDILWEPHDYHSINIAEADTSQSIPLLSDPESIMFQAHLSPDEKWVTFISIQNDRSRIFVVPYRRTLVPKSQWIQISPGRAWDDKPHFSSDGQLIFFTSDRDGYRCIWTQPLTADMHPRGDAVALYHLHSSRRALDGVTVGGLELAVGPGLVTFNQGERSGNLWLLERH